LQVCSKCKLPKDTSEFYLDKRYSRPKKKCISCDAASYKSWRITNKDKVLLRNKAYREGNEDFRCSQSKKSVLRDKLYKPQRAAKEARRRSAKLKATPPWITEHHLEQIKQFYWHSDDLRKVTGCEYHVDHIVPLKGKNVCGLHVPWNLQILPSDINLQKSNKHKE